MPFALITVFGLPIPHALPSLALLTHQLDLPAILKVLSALVWLAWIQLVWCVIAEIRAAVRNSGVARRVPLAGGTQALVHRLVTAALLVFAAARRAVTRAGPPGGGSTASARSALGHDRRPGHGSRRTGGRARVRPGGWRGGRPRSRP